MFYIIRIVDRSYSERKLFRERPVRGTSTRGGIIIIILIGRTRRLDGRAGLSSDVKGRERYRQVADVVRSRSRRKKKRERR